MGIVPSFPRPGERFAANPESNRVFSLDNAYKQANQIISESRIKVDDFIGKYDAQDMEKDRREVQRLETIFSNDRNPETIQAFKLATSVEAVVHTQINSSQWFGPKAKSRKTTPYDDYVNGVDSVIEFQGELPGSYSHLALAVDVTYKNELERKFGRIRKEIKEGKLAEVKYFRSSDGIYEGRLNLVPRVVLAIDGQDAEDITRAWYLSNPALKSDPMRVQFLFEIEQQLTSFRDYARKLGQQNLVDRYNVSLRQVGEILKSISQKPGAFEKYNNSNLGKRIESVLITFV